jgi:hypothetical protein
MNDSSHIDPQVPDDPGAPAMSARWPLRLHCSRVEQSLLLGLRLLTPPAGADDAGMRVLASLRLSNDGQAAFNVLRQLLDSGRWRVRLPGAGSSQVCKDELDLLACLHRLFHAQSSGSRMAIPTMQRPDALQMALYQCAVAMREASLSVRQRALSLSGRRFIDDGIAHGRQAARHAVRAAIRGEPQHAAEPKLLALIREATLPGGVGRIWMAGEAPTARLVRNHLLVDRRLPAGCIHRVGYWKRGEQDHKDRAAG